MERPSRIELESKPWQGLVIAVILWSLTSLIIYNLLDFLSKIFIIYAGVKISHEIFNFTSSFKYSFF